jgi:hypothetical protein
MKYRRHHNNKAYRSTKNGKRTEEVKKIAKKLGIRYGGANNSKTSSSES